MHLRLITLLLATIISLCLQQNNVITNNIKLYGIRFTYFYNFQFPIFSLDRWLLLFFAFDNFHTLLKLHYGKSIAILNNFHFLAHDSNDFFHRIINEIIEIKSKQWKKYTPQLNDKQMSRQIRFLTDFCV